MKIPMATWQELTLGILKISVSIHRILATGGEKPNLQTNGFISNASKMYY